MGSEVDTTTALLMGRIAVLEELTRWLSLAYGDGEPTFAGATGEGTRDGRPLGSAPQLHALWHQVVGRPCADDLPPRRWVECEVCHLWHCDSEVTV